MKSLLFYDMINRIQNENVQNDLVNAHKVDILDISHEDNYVFFNAGNDNWETYLFDNSDRMLHVGVLPLQNMLDIIAVRCDIGTLKLAF